MNSINRFLLLAFICYSSAYQIPRDDYGRIMRDRAEVRQFMKATGYPKGRPGYEVDHVTPLKRGGCDDQRNMQWLTIEEHRKKSASE